MAMGARWPTFRVEAHSGITWRALLRKGMVPGLMATFIPNPLPTVVPPGAPGKPQAGASPRSLRGPRAQW